MKADRVDETMSRLLEAAAPELSAGWNKRAMDRLTASRPSRGISRRLAIAVIGVAALVGLGFVPIPMGSAAGALDRALAAVEQATTLHLVGRGQQAEVELWMCSDGLWRYETRQNGSTVNVWLLDGNKEMTYDAGERQVTETDLPARQGPGFGEVFRRLERDEVARLLAGAASLFDLDLTETRETTAWGGVRDVVEVEGVLPEGMVIPGLPCRAGDRVLIRAEIDAGTGRLAAAQVYALQGGQWELNYSADLEWETPVPESVRTLDLPPGTTVVRDMWWTTHTDRVGARGTAPGWSVVLHSLDVNQAGDLFVTLSRWPESQTPLAVQPTPVQAEDDAGGRYVQADGHRFVGSYSGGYWTVILRREGGVGTPRNVTMTVYADPESPTSDQSVTFRNVPLPPRQDPDDLFAAETEVIQY